MGRHQPHLLVDLHDEVSVVEIDRDARRHLEKVLRITASAPVTYTDGNGTFGLGIYEDGFVRRGAEETRIRPHPLSVAVAAPHDNTRLRFLVEKLAELGVAKLIWLETAHREGRDPRPEKTLGWVQSALEQSRGSWLMEVSGPVTLADVVSLGTPVFAEQGGVAIGALMRIADPVLLVGPEGGFAPGEIPADALRLSLGGNVLRVETAALVGAALLMSAATEG